MQIKVDKSVPVPDPSAVEPLEADLISSMRSAFQMTKQRCYNPTCKDYKYYGGRGITICDRWLASFANFLADMGLRPEGMTLERKDNDGAYSPENCEWQTRKAQGNNTRQTKLVTYEGQTHSVAEWERLKGFKPGTLKARLGPLKYSVEEAFSKSVVCGAKLEGRVYKERRAPDMSKVPRGFTSVHTKLSREDIVAMRAAAAQGQSFSALGLKYGVSVTTASNAVQGKGAYKDA